MPDIENKLESHEIGYFHTDKVWIEKGARSVCIDVTDIDEILHIPTTGTSRFIGDGVDFVIKGDHQLTCAPIKPDSPQSTSSKMVKVVIFK